MSDKLNRVAENLFRSESSGRYYVIFKINGKQIKESLKTRDSTVAKRMLPAKLEELQRVNLTKKHATFEDLLNDYRETKQPTKHLKPKSLADENWRIKAILHAWSGLAETRLNTITAKDVDRWYGRRVNEIHEQRINNEVAILKGIFRYGIREGYLHSNPADHLQRLKVPKKKVVPPTREQFITLVKTLRAAGNDVAADFVELLGYSGMRRDEAAAIVWGEVDFDRGRFWVTGGEQGVKGHDEYEVPLFPALRELLLRIKAQRGTINQTDRIMSIKECRGSITTACKTSGLPHWGHHTMRHFFASNAIEKGIDFKTLAAWLRHKDGGVLAAQVYGHLRRDHSDELAKKMDFSVEQKHIGRNHPTQ